MYYGKPKKLIKFSFVTQKKLYLYFDKSTKPRLIKLNLNYRMKLRYKSNNSTAFSISVQFLSRPYLDMNWHFHKEYELAYVNKGSGKIIVGDYIGNFHSKELFLIAPGLPHVFVNDNTGDSEVEMVFIKFCDLLSGINVFKLPEFNKVLNLLKMSSQGLSFPLDDIEESIPLIMQIFKKEAGLDRLITFFQIMNILSKSTSFKLLSGVKSTALIASSTDERIVRIVKYVEENCEKDIDLDKISAEVSMTPNSLCRFFKTRTGETLFEYIKEYRINKACQYLIGNNMSMTQICYNVGFQSIPSFNRVFKSLTGTTPTEYKKTRIELLKK